MTKIKLFSITISIGIIFLLFSCSEKTPTQSIDTAQLSGYVFQEVNGFFYYIPNAEISIGTYNTTSDSIGRYSIGIPLGEYSIQTSHEQFDTTYTGSIRIRGNRSYLIRMLNGPTYSVSGVVTDTLETVVEGAIVKLEHLRDTTDINGVFIFSDIPSGQKNIRCDYADYFIYTDSFEITNSDISKNINLIRQGYNISGTVSHPVDGLLSGIEVILDDSLYDTTSINGEYQFNNIYVGKHQLLVNSDNYNYDIFKFSLGKSDLYKNLVISKSSIQKILIEKDARIGFSSGNSISTRTILIENSWIGFGFDNVDIFTHQGYIVRYNVFRTCMEIPVFDVNAIDSATLVLSISSSGFMVDTFSVLRISSLSNQWDVSTITWENQPEISNQYLDLKPSLDSNFRWKIDITENADIFNSQYGFKMFYPSDLYCGSICQGGLLVYSSESTELDKRPYILVYRTE